MSQKPTIKWKMSKHCGVKRFCIQSYLNWYLREGEMTRIDVALFGHYVMEIIMIRVVYSISTAAAASETNGFIFFRLLRRVYAHNRRPQSSYITKENKRKCGWSTPQPCEFVDVSITLLVFSIASQKLYGLGLFSFQKNRRATRDGRPRRNDGRIKCNGYKKRYAYGMV